MTFSNINQIDRTGKYDMQYVVICLRDRELEHPATYVQVIRRRFTQEDAEIYIRTIAKSRLPVIVLVPSVLVNTMGYPVFNA